MRGAPLRSEFLDVAAAAVTIEVQGNFKKVRDVGDPVGVFTKSEESGNLLYVLDSQPHGVKLGSPSRPTG